MKRFGIIFLSVFLSVLILLGSGRFTIGKMLCPAGKATYSLGNAQDCCEKKSAEECLKPSCCTLINISYSLNDFNPSEKVKVSAGQIDLSSFALVVFRLPSILIHLPPIDTSPPEINSSLSFLGSFLI